MDGTPAAAPAATPRRALDAQLAAEAAEALSARRQRQAAPVNPATGGATGAPWPATGSKRLRLSDAVADLGAQQRQQQPASTPAPAVQLSLPPVDAAREAREDGLVNTYAVRARSRASRA